MQTKTAVTIEIRQRATLRLRRRDQSVYCKKCGADLNSADDEAYCPALVLLDAAADETTEEKENGK